MRSQGICFGFTFAWLAIAAVLPGCQADSRATPQFTTGTETNWLQACRNDEQCGELSCECGVCTRRCTEDDACNLPEAVCRSGGSDSVRTLCEGEAASGLCLPACRETCGPGQNCVAGACVPESSWGETSESNSGATTPATDAGLSSRETNDSAPHSSDNTAANTGGDTALDTGLDTAADSATDTATNNLETGAEVTTTTSDAGYVCTLEEGPFTEGCCYEDDDCGAGQLCYQAVCSEEVTSPGRCASPPAAPNCYSERDCGAGELCENGLLAACGTSGPDSLGTCVADCEFDSCHPERCDEAGEPCCDPLPGDGPNYCNAGLTCLAEGCARADTTTPEAQARALCETTGGEWVESSCGHYSCGRPPVCAALVPGCNCGSGRNYSTLGCADDVNCETL